MHTILSILSLVLFPFVSATVITKGVSDVSHKLISKDVFDIESFLNGYGYPFENHEVVTEDGYILGLHRIPHGKNEVANIHHNKTKPTVLIMHGLFSNSGGFCILGPNQSIAMYFADLGYDVWLGNNRGNTWSRRHVSLDPDEDASFWDFSFHEFGYYDDAAMIDYILNKTGNEKVSCIGHSQGNTHFFILLSMRPEYNKKIAIMVALAPITFMGNISNPIIQSVSSEALDLLVEYFNITEILPFNQKLSIILQTLCSEESQYQDACIGFVFLLCGFDYEQVDKSSFNSILKTLPAGAAIKQIQHYIQEVHSGHFRPYDYGKESNLAIYNTTSPPDYDLTTITAPVALYYAENDLMVPISNIDRLANLLPNVAKRHLLEYRKFNHIDFLLAKDAISLCYRYVADDMSTYTGIDSIM